MKVIRDTDEGMYAFVTDGVWDLAESTIKAAKTRKWMDSSVLGDRCYWTGKCFQTWDEVMTTLRTPDPENLAKIQEVMDNFRTELRELPETIKRKREWNKSVGNVSVSRAIGGNPNFMYRFHRQKHTGPKNIVFVFNSDATGGDDAAGLTWGAVACSAVIDLLEDAGYMCEVWVTKAGKGTFIDPQCRHSFVSAKVKDCGQMLDLDLLAKVFSPWFLRTALFGARLACPPHADKGQLAGVWFHYPDRLEQKYMDAMSGVLKFRFTTTSNKQGAIAQATAVLKKVGESRGDSY